MDEDGKPDEYEPNVNQFPYFNQRLRSSDSGFSEVETLSTDQWTDQTETTPNSTDKEQFKNTIIEDNLTDQFEDNLMEEETAKQVNLTKISTNQFADQMLDIKDSLNSTHKDKHTNLEFNFRSQFANDLMKGDNSDPIVGVQRLAIEKQCSDLDDNFSDFCPIDLQTQLELLHELNEDLETINQTAQEILQDKNDTTLKDGRERLINDLEKLKSLCREARTFFKQTTRKNFPPSRAEKLIQNPVLIKNQELIKQSQELLLSFNQLIKDRGLNLEPIVGKHPKKIWPVFTGKDLPILTNFLSEINDLCIEQGLPVSDRGSKLYRQVQGTAKRFLDTQINNPNPTFEAQKQALMLGFGKPEQIEELLTKLHRKLPPISANGIEFEIVKEHKIIVDTMLQQHKIWEFKKQGESPLTWRYVKAIMEKIPRSHLFHLYSKPNFANLSYQSRFDYIVLEIQKLYNFANNHLNFQIQNSHFLPKNPLDNDFSMPPPSY